jgi:hypothetical protein
MISGGNKEKMSMTIRELLVKRYGKKEGGNERIEQILSLGRLNLGYWNGFKPGDSKLLEDIREFRTSEYAFRQPARCCKETEFSVSDGINHLSVTYGVDSSD